MSSKEKLLADIKWATLQRLRYIEIMAFYSGVVTRSDVAKAFGLSDAAATKDLKLYTDLAPDNLVYRHSVYGFTPSAGFVAMFADLEPASVLPLVAANLAVAGGPYGDDLVYGVAAEFLPLPGRYPDRHVLAQIIRGIKSRKRVQVTYRSLSTRDGEEHRIIEPHALVSTGIRWHVRGYNLATYDFRDFVLSRFEDARLLDEDAESSADYDDDWSEAVVVHLAPHPGLNDKQRLGINIDYHAVDGVIEIPVRRALVGYLLQRLDVDTTPDQSLNPRKHQLVLLNRDEIEQFAAWALS